MGSIMLRPAFKPHWQHRMWPHVDPRIEYPHIVVVVTRLWLVPSIAMLLPLASRVAYRA